MNLDAPEKALPPAEPVKEDEDEWEYGPGMVLIKKNSGYVQDAGTQSGTWLEEKATALETQRKEDALLAQRRQAQERPSLRSHKSSRIDLSARASAQEGGLQANAGRDLSDTSSKSSSGAGSQPIVDDFTLHLGIGWGRLSEDEHIQAAARGWARYIENHYPVTEPKILLEGKGLESYLVEAQEGFFLFGNDLRQGRLVSSDAQRTLTNLKSNPPVFDGDHVIIAAGTPRAAEMGSVQSTMSATATTATQPSADLDMDMN